MRKLILFMSTSLDGFIGRADEEATADSTLDVPDQEDHQYANQVFAAADTVLFGRRTYERFIGYWVRSTCPTRRCPPLKRSLPKFSEN